MRKVPEEVVDEIFRLYNSGHTYQDISDTLWVSISCIIKKLKALR